MYSLETKVKKFYSNIRFPGPYTLSDLYFYNEYKNNFLEPYVTTAQSAFNILEIGCGTGYITNLIALQNPNCQIDAVDFADSIDYAKKFSIKHDIKNIKYYKQNFLKFVPKKNYDLIISNGVLHHIPNLNKAIHIINKINATKMVLGLYNTYGKLYKKIIPIKYRNQLLYEDQEFAPYEVSFTHKEVLKLFPKYRLISTYPNMPFVDFKNLYNYKNGGLTIYNFIKNG